MNFFWKLYFSIMLIVTVCFGIGGYVLIQSSFHTSLDREIEVSFQENDILYISFERILSTIYGIDSASMKPARWPMSYPTYSKTWRKAFPFKMPTAISLSA